MSSTAAIISISGLETSVARLLAHATCTTGVPVPAEPIRTLQGQARTAIREARAQADAVAAQSARDARFDPPRAVDEAGAPNVDAVRQIVDQIAATLAYRANAVMVQTADATIDISA